MEKSTKKRVILLNDEEEIKQQKKLSEKKKKQIQKEPAECSFFTGKQNEVIPALIYLPTILRVGVKNADNWVFVQFNLYAVQFDEESNELYFLINFSQGPYKNELFKEYRLFHRYLVSGKIGEFIKKKKLENVPMDEILDFWNPTRWVTMKQITHHFESTYGVINPKPTFCVLNRSESPDETERAVFTPFDLAIKMYFLNPHFEMQDTFIIRNAAFLWTDQV